MRSITGIEFNNPDVCIKGMSTFACICAECREEGRNKFKEYLDNPEAFIQKKIDEMPLFRRIKYKIYKLFNNQHAQHQK